MRRCTGTPAASCSKFFHKLQERLQIFSLIRKTLSVVSKHHPLSSAPEGRLLDTCCHFHWEEFQTEEKKKPWCQCTINNEIRRMQGRVTTLLSVVLAHAEWLHYMDKSLFGSQVFDVSWNCTLVIQVLQNKTVLFQGRHLKLSEMYLVEERAKITQTLHTVAQHIVISTVY